MRDQLTPAEIEASRDEMWEQIMACVNVLIDNGVDSHPVIHISAHTDHKPYAYVMLRDKPYHHSHLLALVKLAEDNGWALNLTDHQDKEGQVRIWPNRGETSQ